ncbi:MAG: hypothetical protein CMH26_00050 [Micavibrio sp.]|jgi:uncharacterized protein (TIGR04255 family)|nr:hypothetical protein [Micavibrio sp.]|tara:strand:+ start:1129 stop:1857 length:729 start_codon:yes stop_codon:yes gene_type:complete
MTQENLNLKTPPAMEVVLEVLIANEENIDTEKLKITDENFTKQFSNQNDIYMFEAKIGDCEAPSSKSSLIGYTYENEEELTQYRRNGFSYNKLGNYPGWDTFVSRAAEVYKNYPYNDKKIRRLGLRYINVIEVENYNGVPKDYFNIFLSSEEKASISNIKDFMIKFSEENKKEGIRKNVNFHLSDLNQDFKAKFILDIDVLKTDVDTIENEEELLEIFGKMRDTKNESFFSYLKENVLKHYR